MLRKTFLILQVSGLFFVTFGAIAEEFPCELREPTPEEIAEFNRTATRIEQIYVNSLAVKRINEARRKAFAEKGLPVPPSALEPADAVPFGSEIAGEPLLSDGEVTETALPEPPEGTGPVPLTTGGGDIIPAASYPGQVDNSLLKYFPPIGSQKGGSCASFCTTYYQMTHMTSLARDWDAKNGGGAYRFSTKWTYNLVNGTGSGGSSMLAPTGIVTKHGALTLADWPYDSDLREWCINGDLWRKAIGFRMAARGSVSGLDTDEGLNTLKALITNGYVLVFATEVNSWQQRTIPDDPAITDDDPWVGQKICRYQNGTNGPHGMTIVGYNDYIWCDVNENGVVDAGEKGALKIANSWGTGDWNSGFRWICYDALKRVSAVDGGPTSGRVSAFTSAYWLTAHVDYRPEMVGVFTVRHPKRRQMQCTLGKSDTSVTQPQDTFYPSVLGYDGGDYAFDGTTTVCDGTFAFDFTDLEPDEGSEMRYYFSMRDQTWGPEEGEIKGFELQDADGTVLAVCSDVPVTVADGTVEYVYVDFSYADAPLSTVSIQAVDGAASETGPDEGRFRIDRSGDTGSDLSVRIEATGKATLGNDYMLEVAGLAVAGDVVIPAGQDHVYVDLRPVDDWVMEGTEAAELKVIRGSGYDVGSPDTASVDILDDDVVQITSDRADFSSGSDYVYVPEGASTDVGIRLTAAPSSDVTVTSSRSYGDTDISVTGGESLTFTTSNWDQWQTLTISAAEDDSDTWNGGATVACSAPGMAVYKMMVSEVDNDTCNMLANPWSVEVPEGGTAQFALKCNSAPADTFEVEIEFQDGDGDITVSSGATLTFGPADWDSWKNVTLAAAEDLDGADGVAVFYCRPSDTSIQSPQIIAREVDNDPSGPGIVTGASSVTVPECGETFFTIKLTQDPGGPVTVNSYHFSGDTDISVSEGASLVFDSGNWCQYQYVHLAAAQDTDALDGTAIIRCEIPGVADAEVEALEWDQDKGWILVDVNSVCVLEGATGDFRIKLDREPAGPVTVTTARDTGDTDISIVSGGSLSFDDTDWDTWKTVTLAAAEDADTDNGYTQFKATADGYSDGWMQAQEADNDILNIVPDITTLQVPENGTVSVGVRLSADPGGSVTVNASTTGDADVTVTSGGTLTFDSANYHVSQQVALAAADDADAQDGWAQLELSTSGADTVYVSCGEDDDDGVDIVTDVSEVSVPEGGTASFQVRLSGAPVEPVTLNWSASSGDSDLSVSTGGSLDFDDTNWDTWQAVTVAAEEDTDDFNGWCPVSCSGVYSAGIGMASVMATEIDNDVLQIVTDVSTVDVPEGGTATFQVKLSGDPGSSLTVSVAWDSGDPDIWVSSGSSLTFDSVDWDVYKPVELSASEDADTSDGSTVILCSASGVADVFVTAGELDNDPADSTPPSVVVDSVVLTGTAVDDTAVAGVTVSGAPVTLSGADWSGEVAIGGMPQTIPVVATDLSSNSATVSVTVSQ